MTTAALLCAHFVLLLALPILMVGLVNRTKALWAGRKGPRLLQSASDLRRLLRKQPVYSDVASLVFRLGPLVVLASTLVSGLIVPVGGGPGPLSFPGDFVVVAYLWGLGRLWMMLAAMDAGSAFEAMGASREATYAALLEPALLLTLGTLAAATGHGSFAALLRLGHGTLPHALISVCGVVVLFVVLQVEAGRVPIDDPNTHLELTMIHEVMILDHSGPDLAALQYAAALKLTLCAALIAMLVSPLAPGSAPALVLGVHLGLMLLVAVAVGFVESLVARLKLTAIPEFLLAAMIGAVIALITSAWNQGWVQVQ